MSQQQQPSTSSSTPEDTNSRADGPDETEAQAAELEEKGKSYRIGGFDFSQYYNNKQFSDVILVVGKKQFYTHKLLLVNASEVFESMLTQGKWQEASQQIVTLEEPTDCENVFSIFLSSLYNMSVVLTEMNIIPLLMLYDKYLIKYFKEVCIHYMLEHINQENVIPWYKFACDFTVPELLAPCQKHLCCNFSRLSSRLQQLEAACLKAVLQSSDLVVESEKEVVDFILDWLFTEDRTCQDEQQESFVELLRCARLQYLRPQELYDLEKNAEVKTVMPQVIDKFNLGFKYFVFGSKILHEMSEEQREREMPRIYLSQRYKMLQVSFGDARSRLVVEARRFMTTLPNWEQMCEVRMEGNRPQERDMDWVVEMWRADKDDGQPARIDMSLCPKTDIGCPGVTFKIITVFTVTCPSALPGHPNIQTKMIGTSVTKNFFRSLYGEFWVPLSVHASERVPSHVITSAMKTEVEVFMYCLGKSQRSS